MATSALIAGLLKSETGWYRLADRRFLSRFVPTD
jgi:hypothetical protein